MDNDLLYFVCVILAIVIVFGAIFIGIYISTHDAFGKTKYCDPKKWDEKERPFIAGQCHNT